MCRHICGYWKNERRGNVAYAIPNDGDGGMTRPLGTQYPAGE